MSNQIETLLTTHGLKKTAIRKLIINAFLEHNQALSYNDLVALIPADLDKSTVYRNLAKLEESKLIHAVENTTGILKYALGKAEQGKENPHAHFQCTNCDAVFCLEETEINLPKMPKNFTIQSTNVSLKGICDYCNEKA